MRGQSNGSLAKETLWVRGGSHPSPAPPARRGSLSVAPLRAFASLFLRVLHRSCVHSVRWHSTPADHPQPNLSPTQRPRCPRLIAGVKAAFEICCFPSHVRHLTTGLGSSRGWCGLHEAPSLPHLHFCLLAEGHLNCVRV